jgi:xanthine dehydrogenase accessory factor
MLIRKTGDILGTVGGGKGEALAVEKAKECIAKRRSETLTIEMRGTEAEGTAMICGGTSRMLVEFVDDASPYRTALARLGKGERVLLIKNVVSDGK